jgi:hypothetical protein
MAVSGYIYGHINIKSPPTGLWMRVRRYFNTGPSKSHVNFSGHMGHSSMHWSSSPHYKSVAMVCEAVISVGINPRPLYSPVCERTGYTRSALELIV